MGARIAAPILGPIGHLARRCAHRPVHPPVRHPTLGCRPGRPFVRALATAGILALALPLAAQEARFLPPDQHPAWAAIGRLNVTGFKSRGMCTATLIAPDQLLTAAHCVIGADGRPLPLERLRFVAGWLRGEYAALARVRGTSGTDGFRAAQADPDRWAVPEDSAILTLTAPIPHIPPLPLAAPDWQAPARILGYRWDRPHGLSDSGQCALTRRKGDAQEMRCPATFGNSGGPVLQRRGGRWHVVGVVSAITARGTTFAAPLPKGALTRPGP